MSNYLGEKTKSSVVAAEAKICANAGIPNGKGTEKWSDVNKDLNGFYYISNPVNGWNGCTREQMMKDVTGVREIEVELPEVEGVV